jgi:hypothetical protein
MAGLDSLRALASKMKKEAQEVAGPNKYVKRSALEEARLAKIREEEAKEREEKVGGTGLCTGQRKVVPLEANKVLSAACLVTAPDASLRTCAMQERKRKRQQTEDDAQAAKSAKPEPEVVSACADSATECLCANVCWAALWPGLNQDTIPRSWRAPRCSHTRRLFAVCGPWDSRRPCSERYGRSPGCCAFRNADAVSRWHCDLPHSLWPLQDDFDRLKRLRRTEQELAVSMDDDVHGVAGKGNALIELQRQQEKGRLQRQQEKAKPPASHTAGSQAGQAGAASTNGAGNGEDGQVGVAHSAWPGLPMLAERPRHMCTSHAPRG